MISVSLLVSITAIYLAVLFFIAFVGDKKPVGQFSRFQPFIFTLSLTVYCTSWTFFGAVGNAAVSGWGFFSIYLGPMIVFLFFFPFLIKLIQVSKTQKTTSIADFIGSRYGKNQTLAAVVSVIALVGTVPYISLQLKAVAGAFDMLTGKAGGFETVSLLLDTAFYVALILAIFAVLFGARRIDATEHHRGIINAISFEAVIKLFALLCIGIFSYSLIVDNYAVNLIDKSAVDLFTEPFKKEQISTTFFTQTLLAAGAIFCLPRQFHVVAVEGRGDEMQSARWGFPVFLALVCLSVVPITAAGLQMFNSPESADLFVLTLPMQRGQSVLATISYLGGFSAATGMVIIATVALSTMVSNHLILPALFRMKKNHHRHDFYPTLLQVRRITIFVLMGLAYGYYQIALGDKSLFSIGLISFAAAIQLAPSIIGGLYWRRGHKNGALFGLLAGFIVWLHTLLLPTVSSEWSAELFSTMGVFGVELLSPKELFGIPFSDSLTHGVFWSLGFNIFFYIFISLKSEHSLTDKLQAAAFQGGIEAYPRQQPTTNQSFKISDLMELCNRFVGVERTHRFRKEIEGLYGRYKESDVASVEMLKQAERVLASSVGSSTAESVLNSALHASNREPENIVSLLAQTSQAIRFNRELLQVTLDNISQGVSVIDNELRLVAWNRPYINLFNYPDGYIQVGMKAEKLIRYNIGRGLVNIHDEDEEIEVEKRLVYLRSGEPYLYERTWKDGTVFQTQGNRLPDGGYVTTYTNITELKQFQHQLEKSNENLEAKVEQRTDILSRLNIKLQEATESKTRFLAAASHDLAQPLSAGKLYLGALHEDLAHDPSGRRLVNSALGAMESAENLLKGLVDISKLDSGILHPEIETFPVQELLASLKNQFSVLAESKGLTLIVADYDYHILSDKNMLTSILQNFLSNAIRYTAEGEIELICHYDNNELQIEVRDTGVGISEADQTEVFKEFNQLKGNATEGLGLGLAISQRLADLLRHPMGVRSELNKGSTFYVSVPTIDGSTMPLHSNKEVELNAHFLEGVDILCIDDEPAIVEATTELLTRWGGNVTSAINSQEYMSLLQKERSFHVILADYHLHEGLTGLEILRHYRKHTDTKYVGILITAERNSTIEDETLLDEFGYLTKPVDTELLRNILEEGVVELSGELVV